MGCRSEFFKNAVLTAVTQTAEVYLYCCDAANRGLNIVSFGTVEVVLIRTRIQQETRGIILELEEES